MGIENFNNDETIPPQKPQKKLWTKGGLVAGAAMLGVAGAAGISKGNGIETHAPQEAATEAFEQFSASAEAQAFINEVSAESNLTNTDEQMERAVKKAQKEKIKMKFKTLALALEQKHPYFSSSSTEKEIHGSPTKESLEKAALILFPSLLQFISQQDKNYLDNHDALSYLLLLVQKNIQNSPETPEDNTPPSFEEMTNPETPIEDPHNPEGPSGQVSSPEDL